MFPYLPDRTTRTFLVFEGFQKNMVPMLDDLGSPACYYWLNTFDELQYLFVNLVGGLRISRRDLLRCSSCPLMGRKPANKWYLDISWPSVCAHVVIFPSIKISISVDHSRSKLLQTTPILSLYRQEWRKGLRAVLYLCLGQFTGLVHRGITLMDCTETVPVSLPKICLVVSNYTHATSLSHVFHVMKTMNLPASTLKLFELPMTKYTLTSKVW